MKRGSPAAVCAKAVPVYRSLFAKLFWMMGAKVLGGEPAGRGVQPTLNHPTVRAAAEAAGVAERTIYRWFEEPAFAEAYRKARRRAFAQAIALTNKYAPLAVQNLAKIANDPGAPHAARVSASSAILKFSRESIELDDLAERVAQLEAAARNTA